jgi:uncharacterized protein (TIGR03000 family)
MDTKFLPGDSLVLCFQIDGAQADAAGKARCAVGLEVVDDKGKLQIRQAPRPVTLDQTPGTQGLAAFAQLQIGLDQPPGKYALKVSVTDQVAGASNELTESFEILPRAFGIVRLALTADSQARKSTNQPAAGRSFWTTFSLVGFGRQQATQQPRLALALRILDERGNSVLQKPLTGEVNLGVSPRAQAVSAQFVSRVQQAGKYTLELKATDQVADRTATIRVPLIIVAAPASVAAAPQGSQAMATITLLVPENAEVFFDEYPSVEKGRERKYSTLPLERDKTYEYVVRALWMEEGRTVERDRRIPIKGGASVRADFLQTPTSPTNAAQTNGPASHGRRDPNGPLVAKLATETGTLLRSGPDPRAWDIVASQGPLQDGDLVMGLPGAKLDSAREAVRLTLHSDFEARSRFATQEAAVRLYANPNVDLDFALERGRVDLENRKQAGPAIVEFHVRNQTWELTLAKPGCRAALDLVSSWRPGAAFSSRPAVPDEPTAVLDVVVLSGAAVLKHAGVEQTLTAPPGLALIEWDSVTGQDDRPHQLEKLPPWAIADDASSPETLAKKPTILRLRQSLATKGVQPTLEELLKANDPEDRRTAICLLAALDDGPRLVQVLRGVDRPELLDAGILALRHRIGRGPGQDLVLYNELIEHAQMTPAQAATVLNFLHTPGTAERTQRGFLQTLAAYLDHKDPLIRGLAYWHLTRLVPAGRDFGYDPLSSKEARAAALDKWKKLVSKPSTPSKKQQAALAALTWIGLALVVQQPSPPGGGGPSAYGDYRNLPPYMPNYQSSYYAPYAGPGQYGPAGGGLTGASNVIGSQGNFMDDQQQAYLMQQQARQQAVQTRHDQVDESLYERAVLPDAVDNEERSRNQELRWARDDPSATEIWAGVALNQLLLGIQRQQAQGIKGADVPLAPSLLKQINVTAGQSGGNLALIANDGKLQWPLALYGDTFQPYRQAIDTLAVLAYQQVKAGPVPAQTIANMTTAVNDLQTAVQASVDSMGANTWIQANNYVNDLQTLTQTLQNPDVGNYLNGTWTAKGATVGQLAQYMSANGLQFAPALPGQRGAYLGLQRAMAAYYLGPNPNRPWDPLDK